MEGKSECVRERERGDVGGGEGEGEESGLVWGKFGQVRIGLVVLNWVHIIEPNRESNRISNRTCRQTSN